MDEMVERTDEWTPAPRGNQLRLAVRIEARVAPLFVPKTGDTEKGEPMSGKLGVLLHDTWGVPAEEQYEFEAPLETQYRWNSIMDTHRTVFPELPRLLLEPLSSSDLRW